MGYPPGIARGICMPLDTLNHQFVSNFNMPASKANGLRQVSGSSREGHYVATTKQYPREELLQVN